MTNLQKFYDTCKLTVDGFTQIGRDYECQCFTDGVPDLVEPEHLIKKVTYTELEWKVSGLDGMVTVTNPNDTQSTEQVPFWRWLADLSYGSLTDLLQDIINIREGRTNTWSVKQDEMYLTIKEAA